MRNNTKLLTEISLLSIVVTSSGNALDQVGAEVMNHLDSGEIARSDVVKPFQGVNFLGYYTTLPEHKDPRKLIPDNYYDQSFELISNAGLDIVRYLFTWESYEKHPSKFVDELTRVARSADKWKLNVIYANDQFHISSWLDPPSGYGFPYTLFRDNKDLPYGDGGASDNVTAKLWWANWYNRNVSDSSGNDGWTLQAEFLKKIVNVVDDYDSTLGYEILNEPQVYSVDQWKKIGNYNTFIADELRKLTSKVIVFDRQLPSDIGGPIFALPDNMAEMAPRNTSNVVFKATLFGLPTYCSYAEARLNTAGRTAQLLEIPLWLGEFNVGITPSDPIADINQSEASLFISKFGEIGTWGWSYWMWSFREHPPNVRNYDLVNVTERDIKTTKYFDYLKNAASEYRGNMFLDGDSADPKDSVHLPSIKDTICPVAPITKVVGARNGTDYSKSTPEDPIIIHRAARSEYLLIEGQAYDSGSGIKGVEVRLKDTPYRSVIPETDGDWSKWSYILPITNNPGENKLIVRATDYANNVKYHTIHIHILRS